MMVGGMLTIATAWLVTGCGGGGGSTSSTPPPIASNQSVAGDLE